MVIHMFLRRTTRRKTYATLGPDTALRVRHRHHRPGWLPPERAARRRSRTESIASAEARVAAVMVGNPGSLGERADGSEWSFGAPHRPGRPRGDHHVGAARQRASRPASLLLHRRCWRA